MLREKQRSGVRAIPADASAANPLHGWVRTFCEWTLTVGMSEYTARLRQTALTGFVRWADERGIRHPGEITRPILQRYQRHLYLYRTAQGKPLTHSSQATRLWALMAFFKWLTREGHILSNPAADLDLPKPPRQLPKHLMSVAQVEGVIKQPDTTTPEGVRDRALLETLYSSGIRKIELMRLKLYEVDTERGTLMVRMGKGRKDRLVPLGARACAWVARYLSEVRPQLLGAETDVLFLTDYGEPFAKNRLTDTVTKHMRAGGVMHGACHAFRHAMATHMLENGADIRFIQAILGHSELSTTQIYTHVAIGKLQAVHALTHPARVQRDPGRARPTDDPSPGHAADDTAKALLTALAREARDDEADGY